MRVSRNKVLKLMIDRDIRSQKGLADMMGITGSALSAILKGGGYNSATLGELCRALDAEPNQVLEWEREPEPA